MSLTRMYCEAELKKKTKRPVNKLLSTAVSMDAEARQTQAPGKQHDRRPERGKTISFKERRVGLKARVDEANCMCRRGMEMRAQGPQTRR